MILKTDIVEIGSVLKPHGINGEMVVQLFDDETDIAELEFLIFQIDNLYVPFRVEGVRPKSAETELVTLRGIENEKQAATLARHSVYTLKEYLPSYTDDDTDDRIYLSDLIGYNVVADEKILGKITALDDTTLNVLFIIENPEGKQLLVPATDEFIEYIDKTAKTLYMSLPDGLIE